MIVHDQLDQSFSPLTVTNPNEKASIGFAHCTMFLWNYDLDHFFLDFDFSYCVCVRVSCPSKLGEKMQREIRFHDAP